MSKAESENKPSSLSIDDPLADEIEWKFVQNSSTNFRTHKLTMVNSDQAEFVVSLQKRLFSLGFGFMGILGVCISCTFMSNMLTAQGFSFDMEAAINSAIWLLGGAVFSIIGFVLNYFATTPIVFNKRKGFFWKGRNDPEQIVDKSSIKDFALLKDIHALQLLSKYIHGDRTYLNYELNLVMESGERFNVVSYGNAKIREDAKGLAEFLGKPLWDAG